MTTLPHDVSDLFLSPVALAVDARIEELGAMTASDLAFAVAARSDLSDWTPELRDTGLLRAVEHLIELHGWNLAWDPRGLRLSHGQHSFVLGVPANFRAYREPSEHTEVGV